MTNAAFTLDSATIQGMVEQAVQDNILSVIETLIKDPAWLEKIEILINQTVVQRTVRHIASTDINSVIHQRVDENLHSIHQQFMKNFSSNGISDQASTLQLTVMDEDTVVENQLTAKHLKVVGNTVLQDLTVTGSINTDNRSWNSLSDAISKKTLEKIQQDWTNQLVSEVVELIKQQGIDFDSVNVHGESLVSGNTLSSGITVSNLQKVGQLQGLQVRGDAHINDTLCVVNRRVGVNTALPESALSIWDEEVSVIIGKHQAKQAYVGTSRDQGLALGVNRQPWLEIDVNGLTRVKKLQVGLHKISHDTQVPGWSGTRGDIVFNSSPGSDRVFAWVCLGAHKWQTLKSAE
jgi:hypothetical protein